MKGKVNELNPHTLDEIRNNIRSVIETIEVAVLPKVNLTMITHESNCLIHKDLITNILCKSVHLVYQKQNETKPFIISPSKRAGFKLENYEYVYLYSDTQPTTLFGGGLLQEFMSPTFNITSVLYVEGSYVLTNSTE